MKFTESLGARFQEARTRTTPRAPLRTLAELADEFGVTKGRLMGLMNSHHLHPADVPPPPEPAIKRTTSGNYYPHAAMRQWWQQLQQKGINV